MAQRCDICGKGPLFGHGRSHAMNTINRRFMPNINKRTLRIKARNKK